MVNADTAPAIGRHASDLLDAAPDAMVVVRRGGEILLVNTQAERLFGYARAELVGRPVEVLVPPAAREHHARHRERYAGGPHGRPMGAGIELAARRKDGTTFPAEISLSPLETDAGTLITAAVRDVTERRRVEEMRRELAERRAAEDARRESESRLRWLTAAVEQSPASVLITATDGTIEYVNARFTEITGYAEAEVLGRTPAVLKSGLTPPEAYRALWATIRGGAEWRGELQNRRKDGELYWDEARISPLRDAAGAITHFLAVQQDVTRRKRAEAEVRALNEGLERRVRERTAELEAANAELRATQEALRASHRELEAFTYSVSHDLRAPIRHVDGFARLLAERAADALDAQGAHYLGRVRDAAREMGRLVDDLLALSRLGRQDLRPRPVDLGALVREVVAEQQADLAGREVEWRVGSLPTVRCDPGLVKVALTNLLANAAKYTRPRSPAVIEVGAEPHAGGTAVFVRDNGVGFDMAYADRLFGPFQRLHRADEFEGTGVGLATVQRIVRRHGGEVWAEAEPDRGATFRFTLGPAAAGEA